MARSSDSAQRYWRRYSRRRRLDGAVTGWFPVSSSKRCGRAPCTYAGRLDMRRRARNRQGCSAVSGRDRNRYPERASSFRSSPPNSEPYIAQAAVACIVKTIAVFDHFCQANDLYEEHDFGSFEAEGPHDLFQNRLSRHHPYPSLARPRRCRRDRARAHHHARRRILKGSRSGRAIAALRIQSSGPRQFSTSPFCHGNFFTRLP